MENQYVQALIIIIGGPRLPNETMKMYLVRVSLDIDHDYWSVRDAYYTGRMSKNLKAKLETAAQHAEQTRDVITYLELKLTIWERYPQRYRRHIAAARACVESLKQANDAAGAEDDVAGCGDAGIGEAAAAGLA